MGYSTVSKAPASSQLASQLASKAPASSQLASQLASKAPASSQPASQPASKVPASSQQPAPTTQQQPLLLHAYRWRRHATVAVTSTRAQRRPAPGQHSATGAPHLGGDVSARPEPLRRRVLLGAGVQRARAPLPPRQPEVRQLHQLRASRLRQQDVLRFDIVVDYVPTVGRKRRGPGISTSSDYPSGRSPTKHGAAGVCPE
jgi:hypothetical protein